MSALYDMISAFIALLMSAALLHFGASSESRPAPETPATHALASASAPAADPVVDDGGDAPAPPCRHAHHQSAHRHSHGEAGAQPMLETMRAPSPARRG